jgi:hypothetical protein
VQDRAVLIGDGLHPVVGARRSKITSSERYSPGPSRSITVEVNESSSAVQARGVMSCRYASNTGVPRRGRCR